jgi:S1-C subfamily serine protease
LRRFQTTAPILMVIAVGLLLVFGGPRLLRQYTLAEQSARIVLAREELAGDDILRRIDRAVSAIADAAGPSVVHIETAGESRGLAGSSGAGWVYDGLGHVVTNAHVVRGSRRISVEFTDGVVTSGTLIGSDVYTDIAVVRVDRPESALFPAFRSVTRLPRVGERVFAFGSPFGFKFSMSEGVVSGLGRQAPGSSIPGGYTNYIQTDAAVNPGNSGGPLINTDGHVIGMNVAIATSRSIGASPDDSGGDSAGISFAIPLGTIEPIVDQLIRYGEVSRGYLGINFGGVNGGLYRLVTGAGETLTGIRISGVEPGGPSDRAGLQEGDVIVSVSGSPILTPESLSSLVSSGRPGDAVDVRVWRDDRLMDMTVVLAPMRAAVLAQRLERPTQMRLGAQLRTGEDGGVAVVQVWDGLPAEVAGLRVGDRIVRVENRSFNGFDEFLVAAADAGLLTGQTVTFEVMGADGGLREVDVTLYP